ncbi:MAG TPA: hypothetical protein VK599_21740 [Streptosporangiaceae bacterium]|nr:hypothetical protein [Streptosporangiaceae bacterium]
MAPETEPTVSVTLELSQRVADLLTVLTTGEYAPDDLEGVLMELVDHAQQGVYRPGAWERGWLRQAFGEDWESALEPDTDDVAGDGRVIFQRPIRPCPNTPPCGHPLSNHVGEDGALYCLDCSCGDDEDEGNPVD